jgi:hypothetical protein
MAHQRSLIHSLWQSAISIKAVLNELLRVSAGDRVASHVEAVRLVPRPSAPF